MEEFKQFIFQLVVFDFAQHLTKTLLTAPRVLIMDNPFIGLDAPTRELLFSLLERLTKMSSVQIVLVLSMLDDIPSFITHVIPVDKMEVFPKMAREAYLKAFHDRDTVDSFEELQKRIIDLPYDGNTYDSDEVVKLNKVSIRYDDRTILKELDWTVCRGEKWNFIGGKRSNVMPKLRPYALILLSVSVGWTMRTKETILKLK